MKRRRRSYMRVSIPGNSAPAAIKPDRDQPRPSPNRLIYAGWAALFAITFSLGVYFDLSAENRVVYERTHELQPQASAEATTPSSVIRSS